MMRNRGVELRPLVAVLGSMFAAGNERMRLSPPLVLLTATVSAFAAGLYGCSGHEVPLAQPVGRTTTTANAPPSSTATIADAANEPRTNAAPDTCRPEDGTNVLGSVLFDPASAVVTPEGNAEIRRMAACFTRGSLADASMIVVGHTDAVGGAAENAVLGLDRAAKVRDFLVAHGVPRDRVLSASTGERLTETARPGRRVDVLVVPGPGALR